MTDQKLITALRLVRADIATLYPGTTCRGGSYPAGHRDGYYGAIAAALRLLDKKIEELEES